MVAFAGQISALLLSPVAGVLADRWNRHRTVLTTQSLSMIHAVVTTILVATGVIAIWQIIALTAVIGLINALDMPTRQALVVDMIEDRADLGNAIALNSLIFHVRWLDRSRVGGNGDRDVSANGRVFLLNASAFWRFSWPCWRCDWPLESVEPPSSHVLHGVGEGVAYAFRSMPIRTILAVVAMVGLVGTPLGVLMPVLRRQSPGRRLGNLRPAAVRLGPRGFGRRLVPCVAEEHRGPRQVDGSDGRAARRRDRRRRLHQRA